VTESYGTIIHPSVFFLQDTYPKFGVREALQKVEDRLDEVRRQLRSVDHGDFLPWMVARSLRTRYEQVRILICGRSGVGKSTLLNRIFGVDLVSCSFS
jgi:predicted GTPase